LRCFPLLETRLERIQSKMAPKSDSDILYEDPLGLNDHDHDDHADEGSLVKEQNQENKKNIVWKNVIWYTILHLGAVYGFYQTLSNAKWLTIIWTYLLYVMGGLGITAGAHRLWSHRSYKANTPYRFILMIFNCVALQNDVIDWARDHRVHHKYSETDADPHNAARGFFFSHMGWLLVKKHPDVMKKGKQIDLSDLYNDPVLAFQRKYYRLLAICLCFVLPTIVPVYLWNENVTTAYFTAGVFRYTWLLHCTWAINSIAHMFGNRPYDKNINPRQNILAALMSLGEGWHNYHHVFPYDYRASEFPYTVNLSTVFIDSFAKIGWVYDRKSVHDDIIQKKIFRSGEIKQ